MVLEGAKCQDAGKADDAQTAGKACGDSMLVEVFQFVRGVVVQRPAVGGAVPERERGLVASAVDYYVDIGQYSSVGEVDGAG